MGLLDSLVGDFTHSGGQGQGGGQRGVPPPPQVPYPWRAMWDAPAGRYLFVNEHTGERTFDFPQQYPSQGQQYGGGGGGYGQQGYGQQGYGQGGYLAQEGGFRGHGGMEYGQEARPKQHHYGEAALAGAAGLAGGALLMHEGEKVHDDYEEDKYRVEGDFDNAGRYAENKFDNGVNDVENFPDNATRWTGEEVQRVEDIPDRIENRFDQDVQNVEDIPEDVSGWAGRKVGDVERFDDNIDNAYDAGRDEQRYDDNDRY